MILYKPLEAKQTITAQEACAPSKKTQKKNQVVCQSKYLVGLREGAQRIHISTKRKYASRIQNAGIIQAICHSSLKGSVALKYS